MILSRERGNRIWGGGEVSGGGGGVSSSQLAGMLIGYATETWVDEHYISIDFFSRLFQAHGTENGSEIDVMPNDLETTITSVESMFGFWTNLYISALGSNGAAPAGISLGMLTDVVISGTPSAGQVLTYDVVTQKWINSNAATPTTSLSALSDVTLGTLAGGQVLLYDTMQSKWINSPLKTINGNPIYGSGDITISGGGGGSGYLPLSGGTMTGNILFQKTSFGGANNTGNARIGAFDHQGGLVVQLGNYSGNINSFEIINAAWSWAIFSVNNNRIFAGKGDTSQYNGGAYMAILQETSDNGNYKALTIGNPTRGFSIGVDSNNVPTIGSYGGSYPYPVRISANVRVDFGLEIYNLDSAPYIDFHYYNSSADYTSRIIEASSGTLQFFHTSVIIDYNLGVGTSPSYKLHVSGTIYATGAITALSDARKKDITGEADVTVEQIAHAPAVQFLWKDKERRKDGQQVGTLAQYWRTVLPEVVSGKGGELSMQYGVAALVSAIVTARKVVDHERRITELEKENERLKEEVSQLRLN